MLSDGSDFCVIEKAIKMQFDDVICVAADDYVHKTPVSKQFLLELIALMAWDEQLKSNKQQL